MGKQIIHLQKRKDHHEPRQLRKHQRGVHPHRPERGMRFNHSKTITAYPEPETTVAHGRNPQIEDLLIRGD